MFIIQLRPVNKNVKKIMKVLMPLLIIVPVVYSESYKDQSKITKLPFCGILLSYVDALKKVTSF